MEAEHRLGEFTKEVADDIESLPEKDSQHLIDYFNSQAKELDNDAEDFGPLLKKRRHSESFFKD